MAHHVRKRFSAQVLSGRAVGRAVWGDLGYEMDAALESYSAKVAEGKKAYQQLQINEALEAMEEARRWQSYCGSEIRDPILFTDLHLYAGLSFLAQAKPFFERVRSFGSHVLM